MKVAPHRIKNATLHDKFKERQNFSNLSRTSGKSRVEKANLQSPIASNNNRGIRVTFFILQLYEQNDLIILF